MDEEIKMSMATVVSVGSIMVDLMSYVPRMPKAGESLLGCKVVTGCGGKGANTCVAASRLGALSLMIGKVGNDTSGAGMLENFTENQINADFVYKTAEAGTGVAIVIVEECGENRIIVSAGANQLLTPEEVARAEPAIKNCKVLTANFEVNLKACKQALTIAKKHGVKTILNAAPAVQNPDKEFFTLPDIFCVNETEAEIITGIAAEEENFKDMMTELIKRGCKTVIMTVGEKGALVATQENPTCVSVNAKEVDVVDTTVSTSVVDTTGAGDAFNGALAYFMSHYPHLTLKEQIERSCIYASLSVAKAGTQTSYPWRNDLPPELFN